MSTAPWAGWGPVLGIWRPRRSPRSQNGPGIETGLDVLGLSRTAEATLDLLDVRPGRTRDSLLLGYSVSTPRSSVRLIGAGVRVDPADVLVELGNRRAVGGQEDMIVDVAAELAAARIGAEYG